MIPKPTAPRLSPAEYEEDDPSRPYISVVVPVMNEQENVPHLVPSLFDALEGIKQTHEVLIVDDGSTDGTLDALRQLTDRYPDLVVISLTRNFGQTAALAAGLETARGHIIVTADGDMQNDPADIPLLVDTLNQGYDIVSGWRFKRHDNIIRKIPSRIANWLFRRLVDAPLHDLGCSLKAYRAWVIREIRLYGDMHRFIAALGFMRGAKIGEVRVRHHPRTRGKAKYGLGRTTRVILDLMLIKFLQSYSTAPIRLFGGIGLFASVLGFIICAYLAFIRLFLNQGISNRPLLLLGVLLIFVGVQFISTGLLAELQIRTYHESQRRPIYVVRELLRGPSGLPSADSTGTSLPASDSTC